MTEPVLLQDRRGNVLVLTLNRPEARNALSPALMQELGAAVLAAEDDVEVRCLVLAGTGDKAWCAGLDLRGFAAGEGPPADERAGAAFARLVRGKVTLPVVAAVGGSALAGGLELMLGCDVVVAAEHASFGLPEVKRGLFAAGGGIFLGTRIPLAVALELALTGDPVDADRARALGLVNHVVPAERVLDEALELAARIARNAPLALAATKELMRTAVTHVSKAVDAQKSWHPTVFGSADAKEGATAFVERRDPVWTGR